jgi:N-acetylmuramoyl-L-alanine amidase
MVFARRSLTSVLTLMAFALTGAQTICIDPGHPSENGRGSKGKKIDEVAATWKVGIRIKQLLTADGYRVVLTKRSLNQKVLNKMRAEIANAAKADLMLRLHCDASGGTGISVYYPDNTGKVNRVIGPSKQVRERSKALAAKLHPALIAALNGKHPDRGLLTDRDTAIGRKQGALTGSIYSKVPVVLIEMAVLTNPKDEALLTSKDGFELLCRAIYAGVRAAVPRKLVTR